MYTFTIPVLALAQLFSLVNGIGLEPSLEHRQAGSCATAPCAVGYCCSVYDYCGTGSDYCQIGSCTGGVGGTCASGECCSPYGYCGTGEGYCSSTTSSAGPTSTSTTSSAVPTSSTTTISSTTSSSSSAAPTPPLVAEWNQCGGEGWTGGTICEAPYVCTYYSVWWSSCR